MEFKRHIILSMDYRSKYSGYPTLHMKVRMGTTSEELKKDLSKDWTPDPKDRLYFFPGCSVPRFKVKDKYKVTIKPEYATAAFISPTELKASDDMFDVITNAVGINGNWLMPWLEFIYGEQHHFVIKFKSLFMNCSDYVMIHADHWYKLLHNCPDDATNKMSISNYRRTYWGEDWGIPSFKENSIRGISFYNPVPNSKLDKLNCEIYSQDAILKYLNEDSVIIDAKRYEELRLMASSSDKENIILVMELMANANFKESFVYLLLLLKEFNSKIAERKEVNHVNFRALLNFFNMDPNKIKNIGIETMMSGMKKHKQFTRENVQRISQFFADPKNAFPDTEHFTNGPVLKPEAESMLDDDYVQDDDEVHIPEGEDSFNL